MYLTWQNYVFHLGVVIIDRFIQLRITFLYHGLFEETLLDVTYKELSRKMVNVGASITRVPKALTI